MFFFIIMEKPSSPGCRGATKWCDKYDLFSMLLFNLSICSQSLSDPVEARYAWIPSPNPHSVSTVCDICVPFWCTIGGLWRWAGNHRVPSYVLRYFPHVFRKLLLPPRCPLHQRHKSEMFYDTFIKMMFAFGEADVFLCHSESSSSSKNKRILTFWRAPPATTQKRLFLFILHIKHTLHTLSTHLSEC